MLPFGTKPCKVGCCTSEFGIAGCCASDLYPVVAQILKTLMTLQNSQVVLAHQNGMFGCCNWLVAAVLDVPLGTYLQRLLTTFRLVS